jgi:ABC-type transport system substrate-binding protein
LQDERQPGFLQALVDHAYADAEDVIQSVFRSFFRRQRAGQFVLESWDKGRQLNFVANDKYTGPYPPLLDKIVYRFIEPEVRFAAYKNGELDSLGGAYTDDLPPSAMAEDTMCERSGLLATTTLPPGTSTRATSARTAE